MSKSFESIRRFSFAFLLLAWLAFTAGAAGASTSGMAPGGPTADEPLPSLFSDVDQEQLRALEGTLYADALPFVLQQRFVSVQQELLGSAAGQGDVLAAELAIQLNLFDDASYQAAVERVVSAAPGELVWYGRLPGIPDGRVVLSVYQEATAGTIWANGRHFRLKHAGAGLSLVQELQPVEPYPEMGPWEPEAPVVGDAPRIEDDPQAPSDDGSIIDVLVAYTPAARLNNGGTSGILALIQTAVAEANQGYANSMINTQLRLVYAVEVSYTENSDMGVDLSWLQGSADGVMDNVHALRNTYKADLVSLIRNSHSLYCGLANLMNQANQSYFESMAFSVVTTDCATGYYSFAHELGHNMGSHHDRANASSTPFFPYSYGYQAPDKTFRTIMAYNCLPNPPGCPRVQYFSNPNVYYNGQPTGVDVTSPQSAYNALSINNTRGIVANFRAAIVAPPGAFTKNSPADGASGIATNLTLNWGSSSGAMSYEYCIDTSNDDSCAGNNWLSVGSSTSVALSGLSHATAYYWQVRSRNTGGITEANSGDWWQFTTQVGPPGVFEKTVPVHQALRAPIDLTLAWGASTGATGYAYCLDTVDDNSCNTSWLSVGSSTSKALSGLSQNTTYYWQVRASNPGGTTYANSGAWWRFMTTNGRARMLLVDDDDNNPDVSFYYADALSSAGVLYDLWDTNNTNIEPSAVTLNPYRAVAWFSGYEWDSSTGPGSAGEAALGAYLNAGNCLFISSQDYYYAKGQTLTSFMDTYLGVSSVVNDVGQTQVTGMGELSSLGTIALSFPDGFHNYSDKVFPDAGAGVAWQGVDHDPAGVYKDSGVYRTSYWGFPFEALSGSTTRAEAMRKVLNWCSPGFASPLVINELDTGTLDAIEVYNSGSETINLSGWKVRNYASDGSLFATYTFPTFTLGPGAYMVVYEGEGNNTSKVLYAGYPLSWSSDAGAATLLDPRDVAADFLRWGSSNVPPPSGTDWSGSNPGAPVTGTTLGRDASSTDTDRGADWQHLGPTLGAQNVVTFDFQVYLPLAAH